jgi:hypothetical protein
MAANGDAPLPRPENGDAPPPLPEIARLFRLEQFLRFIGLAAQVSSITALYDDLDDLIDRTEVSGSPPSPD